ncbi:MAG: mechanosensitive ion channel family protein [Aquificaceae bacterium]
MKYLLILFIPIVGFLFEKLLFYPLKRVEKLKLLVENLRFMPTLWSLLLALYLLSEEVKVSESLRILKEKALWLLLIFSIFLFLSRLLSNLLRIYLSRYQTDLPAASLLVQALKAAIMVVGIIIALDKIGIAITPILTALGVGGLAVALALRDTLENLFAGFHILASRQIKVGDYIKLSSGEEGFVEDITWRNTLLRHPSNNIIIVPNSKLSTSILTNFHMPQHELSVIIPVGVSYDSDLEKVERITLEVAREVQKEVESAVQDFEPLVRFFQFGDFSINFNVVLRAKDFPSQYLLRSEFIKRLKKRYEEEGIKIPFPVREVYLASSSEK